MKKSKADGSLKKKEKSKAGKYSKVPPPKQQVEEATQEEEDEQEPMEGMRIHVAACQIIYGKVQTVFFNQINCLKAALQ